MRDLATGPRTWILPLIHEEAGRETDPTHWWESDYVLLARAEQRLEGAQARPSGCWWGTRGKTGTFSLGYLTI